MAETEFIQSVPLVDPKTGMPTKTALQKLNGILRGAFGAQGGLPGKAGRTQKTGGHWLVPEAENKTYPIMLKAPFAFSITETTTKSSTGTCTVTFRINGVALGGGANSASTDEQSQTHSSANEVAAGDTVDFVVTSNSGCENLSISIAGTEALDP